jgi:hypothetical protein
MMMRLDIYSDSSLKQQSAGRHVAPLGHYYSNSEPTRFCSFSLGLCGYRKSNKYQFNSLWFDPIGARTHIQPHSQTSTNITEMKTANFHIVYMLD